MPYHPGELDKRISFMELRPTGDGGGGRVSRPMELFSCWAHVRPRSSAERAKAGQVEPTDTYLVVIRNSEKARSITRSHYIDWDGVRLNIKGIPDRGRRPRYLEIEAERA